MRKLSLFNELKTLITDPVKFFTKIAPHKKLRQAFLFDLVQNYIGFAPLVLFYVMMFSFIASQEIDFPIYGIIIGAVIGVPLLSIIYTFVAAGFSHVILKLAKGKGQFEDTYIARVYSSFPSAVGMFFFMFGGGLLSIYSLVLQVIAYAKMHKISYWRGAIPLIVSVGLVVVMMITFFTFIFSQIDSSFPFEETTTESLVVGNVVFGEDYFQGPCMQKETIFFTDRETMCVILYNVSGFTPGPDGVHWFDFDSVTRNWNGEIVYYSRNIYDEDGKMYLKDGILDDFGVITNLEDLAPGEYTISTRVYDRYSGKEAMINNTFQIRTFHGGELTFDTPILGHDEALEGGDCLPTQNGLFSSKNNVCLKPVNVKGFSTGKDGLHWFEMDFKVTNENGIIVDSYSDNLFGEEGHVYLENGMLNDHWVIAKNLPPGRYNFELIVRDRISKKRAYISEAFIISN